MADNLTRRQRSYCMSRVSTRDTDLEVLIRSKLHKHGLRFRKHVTTLPGTPDIVFPRATVAVFVDGDFWHGYRLPAWEHTLSQFWKDKLRLNRRRDRRNSRKLRAMGWHVIRLWQHDIEENADACVNTVAEAVAQRVR